MKEFIKYKNYKTGLLPWFSKKFIALNDGNSLKIFNPELELKLELESKYIINSIKDDIGFISDRKSNQYLLIDLSNNKILKTLQTDLIRGIAIGVDYYFMYNKKNNNLTVFDISNETYIWSINTEDIAQLKFFGICGQNIICSTSHYAKKINFDLYTGKLKWQLAPHDLQIPYPCSNLGLSYYINNTIIGYSEHNCWYAVHEDNKRQIWWCKLPEKRLGGKLYKNCYYSFNIPNVEFKHKQSIVFSILDLIKGYPLLKTDITKNLNEFSFIRDKGFEWHEGFNAITVGETHLFFAFDNHLFAMDFITFQITEIFTHIHSIIFAQIYNKKLFVTDDSFNLMVFEGEQLLNDTIDKQFTK